jgi:hypothetical protein
MTFPIIILTAILFDKAVNYEDRSNTNNEKRDGSRGAKDIFEIQRELITMQYGYTPRRIKEENEKRYGKERADELEKELYEAAKRDRKNGKKVESFKKHPFINNINNINNDDFLI